MNKFTLITNGYIQNPGAEKIRADVLVQGNKIIETGADCRNLVQNSDVKQIDAKGCLITPGLIDQHIHGGYGCDFNTAGEETIINFLKMLPKHGVTAICPTLMTDTLENIKNRIKIIKQAKANLPDSAAKIIGLHLEGPFISPEYKGAHDKSLFLPPNVENYQLIEDDEIKIITISPELDPQGELVSYLKTKGVIASAGHTNAQNMHGLRQITHIFNAMPPLHHRNPGIIGEALINDEVYTEVIADFHHLHPDIIKLILRSKPKDKVIYISDSLPLNRYNQDSMMFGGQKILKNDEVAVNEQGNFAGSLLFLDSVVRKNLKLTDFSDLLFFTSLNPAQNLGLPSFGQIKKGMCADLLCWDEKTLEIKNVLINGEEFAA